MAENQAPGHTARLSAYKNKGRDVEDLRRRRVETSVELRKQKKDETMLKRRNIAILDDEPTSPLQESNKATLSMADIKLHLQSKDESKVLHATLSVRKLLSKEKNPPIDRVIEEGIVDKLVTFLDCNDNPELQFEAAWALTNIASGTTQQTQTVVRAGAVPRFIRLLEAPSMSLVEQCIWALGNIAGDGAEMRDLVTSNGIIEPLIRLVSMSAPSPFLRNLTWTFSNLCRNKNPPPSLKAIQACLPALRSLVQHTDREVLADTCWALSYVTDGANNQIQEVVQHSDIIHRLVELLASADPSVVTPALRTVGNIVTGDDTQTQTVMDAGVLSTMSALLQHSKPGIKKESCWMLSNITAGSVEQIQAVLGAELLPLLVEVLKTADFKSQKEAAWAVTNLTSGGSVEQVSSLVAAGALNPMCDLLESKDAKLLMVLLDGVFNILEAADKVQQAESICLMLEECGGLDKIEHLQNHENTQVYKKALDIIDKFFSGDEEDGELAPEGNADSNQYKFSADSTTPAEGFNF